MRSEVMAAHLWLRPFRRFQKLAWPKMRNGVFSAHPYILVFLLTGMLLGAVKILLENRYPELNLLFRAMNVMTLSLLTFPVVYVLYGIGISLWTRNLILCGVSLVVLGKLLDWLREFPDMPFTGLLYTEIDSLLELCGAMLTVFGLFRLLLEMLEFKRCLDAEHRRVLEEIAERTEAEQRLQESEERFRFALEGANDAFWDWDYKNQRVFFSLLFSRILGYDAQTFQALLDKTGPFAQIHPEDQPAVEAALEAHLQGETPFFNTEMRMRCQNGDWRWVQSRAKVMARDENGAPLRLTGTHSDISERKKAEARLQYQQEQLTVSARFSSLGVMASGLAHEINNPLAAISVATEQLHRIAQLPQPAVAHTDKLAGIVQRNIQRIERVMRGIRILGQAPAQMPLKEARAEVIIENALSLCHERFRKSGICLRLGEFTPSMKLICRAGQVSQAIMSLLNNAYEATLEAEDRWISLEVQERGSQIAFIVENSGPRIPEAQRHKIFEPFFTTRGVGNGAGLGLSVTKAIAVNHRGRVYLDSAPHTRFVLELPKHYSLAPQVKPQKDQLAYSAGAGPGQYPSSESGSSQR